MKGSPPGGRRSFWAAFLIGIGTMAAVDEIVFHQLLRWHHFVDGASGDVGLISDGILHSLELLALAAGFFLLLDARRREGYSAVFAWSGFLVGLGAFQLWDGVINHKVLGLHQIRYGVDLLAYDIAWYVAAALLLIAGLTLAVVGRRRASRGAGGSAAPA
nr:DUF2243 domain-containing protein [uncultured Microbacterium sp.]